MRKEVNSKWYQEGVDAKLNGQSIEDCPYKINTFGYAEWIRGFNSRL